MFVVDNAELHVMLVGVVRVCLHVMSMAGAGLP